MRPYEPQADPRRPFNPEQERHGRRRRPEIDDPRSRSGDEVAMPGEALAQRDRPQPTGAAWRKAGEERRTRSRHGADVIEFPACRGSMLVEGTPDVTQLLGSPFGTEREPGRTPCEGLRLYTCSMDAPVAAGRLHAFCALMARDEAEARRRLGDRYPGLLNRHAAVRVGFDWSDPIANELVSGAVADMLSLVAGAPSSSLADGLELCLEQHFVR